MTDLILLTLGNYETVRCADLNEATAKAISCCGAGGTILVEFITENGGPMISLEFDRASHDWIPAT
jgi:hypothetical protein